MTASTVRPCFARFRAIAACSAPSQTFHALQFRRQGTAALQGDAALRLNVRIGSNLDANDRFQILREHNVGRPVERRMSNSPDQLRAKARQTRFLARQALIRSRVEALNSLATVYENQAAELERSASLSL